jgi:hypothetical protein
MVAINQSSGLTVAPFSAKSRVLERCKFNGTPPTAVCVCAFVQSRDWYTALQ